MKIKKVEPFSLAKVSAGLYLVIGVIAGVIIAFFSLIGFAFGGPPPAEGGRIFALFFGVGSIVLLPMLYCIFGFIGGLIFGALYNVAAGLIGPIEIEVEQ